VRTRAPLPDVTRLMEQTCPSCRAPRSIRQRYGRAAVLGLFGTALVSLTASLPGSPFAFKVPGAWFFGVPSPANGGIAHASGFLLLVELTGGFAGILLLCRAWLSVVGDVSRATEQRTGRLGAILALWAIPLLVAPPMFSNDIYDYAGQGELVSRHINPYLYGPGILGGSPFSTLARGFWINTPSPYGPLFNGLDGGIVQLTGHRVLVTIVVLRLLAVLGVVLIAVFLPLLARSYGRDPSVAFSLGILNPLALLFLIGSGHNDALMVGLLMAGLYATRRGFGAWGIVLCALAGAVKAPGLIGVFAIGWTSGGTLAPWRRLLALCKAAALSAVTLEALSLLFGLGWGWVGTLGVSDTVTSWVTPVDLIAKAVPAWSGAAHVIGPIAAVAIVLWQLKRLPVIGLPRAMGISILAIVLLGPIVQPWYLMWAIPILALTADARTTAIITSLSVAVSVLGVVGLGELTSAFATLGALYKLLFALILAATLLAPIRRTSGDDRTTGLSVGVGPRHTAAWPMKRA
jgi:alpha-1,6-mannosyltransferase